MARLLAVLATAYLVMRFLDLARRGALGRALEATPEAGFFWLETALLAVPAALLYFARVRANPKALYGCAVLVIFGFITHRLNVSVTGMDGASGVHYVPKWTEVVVTLAIVALGFALFRAAVQYLPIFEQGEQEREAEQRAAAIEAAPTG
jgi:Ni/Fe-hydrogenase subunit HybB-like protein